MMTANLIERELLEVVQSLTDEQKQTLLQYARNMGRPAGISGKRAVQIADELNFSPDDLTEMSAAMEAAFEQVYPAPEVNLDG
jgi:hypothetical protein